MSFAFAFVCVAFTLLTYIVSRKACCAGLLGKACDPFESVLSFLPVRFAPSVCLRPKFICPGVGGLCCLCLIWSLYLHSRSAHKNDFPSFPFFFSNPPRHDKISNNVDCTTETGGSKGRLGKKRKNKLTPNNRPTTVAFLSPTPASDIKVHCSVYCYATVPITRSVCPGTGGMCPAQKSLHNVNNSSPRYDFFFHFCLCAFCSTRSIRLFS